LRKDKAMTQGALAKHLGINRTTLTKYETGERRPDVTVLYKLADYFHVSIEYLTGRTSQPGATLPAVALDEILDPAVATRVTLWGHKLQPEEKQQVTAMLLALYKEWNA